MLLLRLEVQIHPLYQRYRIFLGQGPQCIIFNALRAENKIMS